MRDQQQARAGARRSAVIAGLAALFLGANLVVNIPAASASPTQPARTMQNSATPAGPVGVQGDNEAYALQVLAAYPTAETTSEDGSVTVAPGFSWWLPDPVGSSSRHLCRAFEFCLWTGNNYTGLGIAFSGDYLRCEGWRFEGSPWQDHTYSVWNRVSGPVSIWNRASDGSFNYRKYALLPSGYSHGGTFSFIMDAWVYDPSNNCTRLKLHTVDW